MQFDYDSGDLTVFGQTVHLTHNEREVFALLCKRPRSTESLAFLGWSYRRPCIHANYSERPTYSSMKLVNTAIHDLRRKIAPLGFTVRTNEDRAPHEPAVYTLIPPPMPTPEEVRLEILAAKGVDIHIHPSCLPDPVKRLERARAGHQQQRMVNCAPSGDSYSFRGTYYARRRGAA